MPPQPYTTPVLDGRLLSVKYGNASSLIRDAARHESGTVGRKVAYIGGWRHRILYRTPLSVAPLIEAAVLFHRVHGLRRPVQIQRCAARLPSRCGPVRHQRRVAPFDELLGSANAAG